MQRDIKPENMPRAEIPWLGNVTRRRVNEEHELERFDLLHDEGRLRNGRARR